MIRITIASLILRYLGHNRYKNITATCSESIIMPRPSEVWLTRPIVFSILIRMRNALWISVIFAISVASTASAADESLQPRAETGLKYGTKRSIGTGELWIPLAQEPGRVFYADLRFMGDDQENSEGNAGLGYRQIVTLPLVHEAMLGGHLWLDRRRSEYDNSFYQMTAGVEFFAADWDVRANAYLPLSNEKTIITPNTGSSTPYLAGSGIFYDTTGTLLEEPQPGLDIELGYRIPLFERQMDAIRIYGGGYHFSGDDTDDVTGWRTRLIADVTPDVSLGGRFQHDDERGSQAFLEATLRFPFTSKRSFRENGLRARLDESPERDVDIVTGGKVTDTGIGKSVLSTDTGEAQRILHVDNTAAAGGDGSKENPFNTLKAAEAVLQDYDTVYVHAGDGTSTGQDEGIIINRTGVSLIGSGSDLTFDASRFQSPDAANFNGFVLEAATTAPIITNLNAAINSGVSVLVRGDEAFISGLTLTSGAAASSIELLNGTWAVPGSGTHWESFTANNLSIAAAATKSAINIQNNSGVIDLIDISDLTVTSGAAGVNISSSLSDAVIHTINIDTIDVRNMTDRGVAIAAQRTGTIGDITIANVVGANNNKTVSIAVQPNGGSTGAHIDNVSVDNVVIGTPAGAAQMEIYIDQGSMDFLQITNAALTGSNMNSSGLSINVSGANAALRQGIINDLSVIGGGRWGLAVTTSSTASLSLSISNSTFANNARAGIYLNDDSTGTFVVDLGGGTLSSVGHNSIYGNGTSAPATYGDIYLDLDGAQLPAQNNWWGHAGSPNASQFINEAACPNCGTYDASSPLSSDPNL